MGSRKTWPEQLAERCRAVGWEATIQNGGHFKARLPDGRTMTWAASPSDGNAYKNANREARRLGLDDLEQQAKLQREKARLERIERDRLVNGVPETDFMPPYKEIEAKLTEAVYAVEPSPKKEDEMTKYGFIEVDGIRLGIAEVAKPVMHQHPRGGEPYPLPHCRELLLVDDSIRYQCLKLLANGDVCARHFKTSGGLVVHWARGSHADAEPSPAEPKPDTLIATKHFVLTEVDPKPGPTASAEPSTTEPDTRSKAAKKEDDLAVPTGLMAQAVFQVERLRRLEQTLDSLAADAGSIAGSLERVIEKLPEELVSPELQEKAEKFDAMMQALGQ